MVSYARSSVAAINWGRVIPLLAIAAIIIVALAEPAYAFASFQSKVEGKTTEATGVAVYILNAAAILALIIGIAPMLWGQIKVKWIVSCLCAAVLFGLANPIISAFTA